MMLTQTKICLGLICSQEGRTGSLDRPRGGVPVAAEIMAERARVGGAGGAQGGPGQNHPSLPGRIETSDSWVHEAAQVLITTPPTSTGRYSGAAESEVREGGEVSSCHNPFK